MATAKKKARKPAARKAPKRTAAKRTPAKAKRTAARRTPAKAKRTAKRKPAQRVAERRRQPATLRLQSAAPSFTVNDIEKSLAWYRDVLRFTVKERWEHEGKLLGVELMAGTVTFMLGQDDWKKGRDRVKGEGFRIYCTTGGDVDRLAEQIKASGGTLTQEPRDQSWGTRDFAVADPDGFKITIAADRKR